MIIAVRVEARKLARSTVGVLSTAVIVGGLLALVAGIMTAVSHGDSALTAKLGGATFDWRGLLAMAAQITSAGGLLGFGIVLAWLFAREFGDGTIVGLFAIPIGRGRIAAAKLLVYAVWASALSLLLCAALLALGLLLGLGAPDAGAWVALLRQLVLGILTAAVAMPVAWVATMTRSLLAGVATAVGLVVVAQVGAIAGAGGWMPFAAPALWAISRGGAVSAVQLAIPLLLAAAVAGLTVLTWHRLQLDR